MKTEARSEDSLKITAREESKAFVEKTKDTENMKGKRKKLRDMKA